MYFPRYKRNYGFRRRRFRGGYRRYTRGLRNKYRNRGDGIGMKKLFKVRLIVGTVSTDGAGTISSGASNNPSSSADWGSIAALFDVYKVSAMKLKFIPHKPNDTSVTTGFKACYVVGDSNSGTNPLAAVANAVDYDNLKVVNLDRPWSYYYKCPRVMSSTTATQIVDGGYIATSAPLTSAGIWLRAESLDASDDYGTLIATWYVVAKNRK